MKWKRREFMKKLAGGALAASCAPPAAAFPVAQWESKAPADPYGCLVDLSVCIGCRKCEQGCALANELPTPSRSYDDVR
ncbi:MAG TPA: 4Fe-4S ferredoxin, partial [Candidatus Sumerlaeota bacterium]|nr:4Fe-4S ferredoxin [Candidatus Sumerlaeota bacterium]